ncbi:MAG: nucleotidyltransferase family protein [Clostridia bacterium]|nr:nucleotidyltransferase family protein [Clostridia bacterium]
MELRDALLAALRYELAGTLPENFSFDGVDEAFLRSLYKYSNRQEVAHLCGDALERLGVLKSVSDETAEPYRRRMSVSAYHAEQQRQVFEQISETFDKAAIPYLPLKGMVIRQLYPEPWMRTAGDLDILVKQEDLTRAGELLTAIGAKHKEKEEKHDRTFFFATGVMLELHYRLLEDERANGAKDALDGIWEHVERVDKDRFEYRMKDEWFYYYHLVHAAKHLQEGTCGIRPFLDLWVINHNTKPNSERREKLLEEQGLLPFAKAAEKLSEVWFSDKMPDEWTKSFEDFLLAGGVFGGSATRYAVQTNKKGGKFRFYLGRIFIPYKTLKKWEPILVQYPVLFPFVQVKRWFSFLFCGGVRRNRNTATAVKRIEGGHTTRELREHLGL